MSFQAHGAVEGRSVVGGCTKGERESVPEISLPIINVTRAARGVRLAKNETDCFAITM